MVFCRALSIFSRADRAVWIFLGQQYEVVSMRGLVLLHREHGHINVVRQRECSS